MPNYVVATIKSWNIDNYHRRIPKLAGQWSLIQHRADLTLERLQELQPRYVFFPHWSWRVPEYILEKFECICFHMSDVPYGRGGSPLQNLVVRGHSATKVSALRMTDEIDAGPVYLKRVMSLDGRAEEIYRRAADITFDLIEEIVANNPPPMPQIGDPVLFPRRTPAESQMPSGGDLRGVYDHIRMLDAPTYPPAFLDWGDFHLEFSDASLTGNDTLGARVIIHRRRCPP